MWCPPFANYHFQMGVAVMGFAEDFGLRNLKELKEFYKKSLIQPPNGVLSICKLPFPNGSHCTVMGFAKHFGHSLS